MKKIICLASILMLLITSGCSKEPYEINQKFIDQANELYDAGKFDEVISLLQPEIDKGSVIAKYMVGLVNVFEPIENPDYELGFKYMQEAVDAGYPKAYNGMGLLYRNGVEALGIKPDYDKAIEYYQKAFDAGLPAGMHNMASVYALMDNDEKRIECYEKAAENGYLESYSCLASYYLYENPNYEKAFDCFKKAAEKGDALAMNNMGDMYENGLGVKQDFQKAIECFQNAIDNGEPTGYLSLGYVYQVGDGVEVDLQKAKEYYQLAIDNGVGDAQIYLDALLEEINQQSK